MPYPDNLLVTGEKIYVRKRPHWKVLILPLLFFVLIIGACAALLAFLNGRDWPGWVTWAIVAVAVVALIILVLVPFIRWRTEHFVISNHHIFFRTGLLSRREHQIPLGQIANIETEVTFWGRLMGYGSLIVESSADQPLKFRNVANLSKVQSMLNQLIRDEKELLHRGHMQVDDWAADPSDDRDRRGSEPAGPEAGPRPEQPTTGQWTAAPAQPGGYGQPYGQPAYGQGGYPPGYTPGYPAPGQPAGYPTQGYPPGYPAPGPGGQTYPPTQGYPAGPGAQAYPAAPGYGQPTQSAAPVYQQPAGYPPGYGTAGQPGYPPSGGYPGYPAAPPERQAAAPSGYPPPASGPAAADQPAAWGGPGAEPTVATRSPAAGDAEPTVLTRSPGAHAHPSDPADRTDPTGSTSESTPESTAASGDPGAVRGRHAQPTASTPLPASFDAAPEPEPTVMIRPPAAGDPAGPASGGAGEPGSGPRS